MTIGATIKKLRRERDMTQEQLAAFMNITAPAISQWECDRSAPDISQLPLLANIFEVSTDIILGVDVASKQNKINAILDESRKISYTGEKDKAIELLKNGLREFPDNYKLMIAYADELYSKCNLKELSDGKGNEIAAYLEKIITECTDNTIRNQAVSTACFLYPKIGRYNEAVALAETMSEVFSKNELLIHIYSGTKKYEALRNGILARFTNSIGDICELASSKYDDGTPVFTEDERLSLYLKEIAMFALYFDDGDYLYHAQYVESAHIHAADIYCKRCDKENVLEHIKKASAYAIEFDTMQPDAVHTSLLAKGIENGGVWWHDTSNTCYDLLGDLGDPSYDFIRSEPRFVVIENELKKYAKD